MASIKTEVTEMMKKAMKAGDKDTVGFTRNLSAAIKKKEIDDRKELSDEEVRKVIATLAKQRQDSIEQFSKGGREDLVAKEQAELNFLMQFMPRQLTDEELAKVVGEAVVEAGATSQKDIGNVMKILMPRVQGRADGKRINQAVREKLS